MSRTSDAGRGVTPRRVLVGVLLLVPIVGPLWIPAYAREEPRLGGFPFYYWYQLLWVFLASAVTFVAYRLTLRDDAARRAARRRREQARGGEGR